MRHDELFEERDDRGLVQALPDFVYDPIGALRRRWLPMVLCFGVGLGVTLAFALTSERVYRAVATVLITSQRIPESFVQSTVGEDTLDNVNAMVGKVLSLDNISQVIDDLVLFPEERNTTPRIELVNRVRARVEAYPQRSNRRRRDAALVYEIAYTSRDPQEAADVTNALAALFVDASLSRRSDQAKQTTEFLRAELESDEADLREQSRKVAEFRKRHRGRLPDELESNLRKHEMLSTRRDALEAQIAQKENRVLTLTAPGTGGTVLSEEEVLLGQLRRELALQTAVHTDEHPNVIALRDRIGRLERSVRGTSGLSRAQQALVDAERRDIEQLREQIVAIDEDLADLGQRIEETPTVAEELGALVQREQVLREDHLESMRKVEAAELAENLEAARHGAQVSILDAAQAPRSPTTSRGKMALMGLAASLMFAGGIGVLLELVDPVVVGTRQLERISDCPMLGSLPDTSA